MFDESSLVGFSDDVLYAAFVFVMSRCMNPQDLSCASHFIDKVRSHANETALNVQEYSDSLVRQHVRLAIRLHPLQAAPFLTDDTALELSQLRFDLACSWDNILLQNVAAVNWSGLSQASSRDRIDSIFITFLEWMADVRFMAATDAERMDYLSEFSFSCESGDW